VRRRYALSAGPTPYASAIMQNSDERGWNL
jgi:hypothetical protein